MSQLEDFIKKQSIAIYKSIGDRRVVYLDTKFWITLLEQKDELGKIFYNKVNQLFTEGKCVFPVSEIVVAEIEKQSDISGRYRNIQLIDKFSCGFAIVNESERRKIEFKHWLQMKLGIEKNELQRLIWCKVSFAKLGYSLPNIFNNIPLQQHLDDSVLDYLANSPLLEIEMGNSAVFNFLPDPDILNNDIQKHAHEHKTFRDLSLAEITGILQEYKKVFADIIVDEPQIEQQLVASFEKMGKLKEDYYLDAVFSHFYADHMFNELPVFHIVPILFAHIRHKGIKYKGGNDTIDFLHASFALPFCDYFFTDKKLHLRIKEIKLDEAYNCTVEYELEKTIELLSSI